MKKAKDEFLTIPKILEEPEIATHFTGQHLGYLFFCGLVRGRRLRRTSEISVADVRRLIKFKAAMKI